MHSDSVGQCLQMVFDPLQSLRQVLVELRRLLDTQSLQSSATSAKPVRVVTFPSDTSTNTSPLLRPDSELHRSSPRSRVAPFWGPGLSLTNSSISSPNGISQSSPGRNSILARLHQFCTGERNLRTASSTKVEASSTSDSNSKLWHFDVNMTEDVLRSMFYKRLCWRLGACAAKESLIAQALRASSTGAAQSTSESPVLA